MNRHDDTKSPHTTEEIGKIYDDFAPDYERSMGVAERLLIPGSREWLCGQATGSVLEIAIGSGRNIPYYPADVRLAGIDPSPGMLAIARKRAVDYRRHVALVRGDAQTLPFPDESFDTVIICLSLCTIPDDERAVTEALRVLRPGGALLWLEHVGSHTWPVRLVQRLLEPRSVRTYADHLTREPAKHLGHHPVTIEEIERRRLGVVERLRARKHSTVPTSA